MGLRTMDRARGRWREILPALGIPAKFLNGKHQPCPACGGRDRARYDDRKGDGDYFCAQCGAGKGVSLLMKVNGWDFKTAIKKVDEMIGLSSVAQFNKKTNPIPNRKMLNELWSKSLPVSADNAAGKYLASRHIERSGPCLRYAPKIKHRSGVVCCGMIAMFSKSDGTPETLHRTFLNNDGSKANVDPVKMFMPGEIAKGGAVRLRECEQKLGIAEGIETAMSAAQIHGFPVWAALNAGLLRAWTPPPHVRHVVIFGDNDGNFVGQSAAYDLAQRLKRDDANLLVEVQIPSRGDWNDVLCKAMADA